VTLAWLQDVKKKRGKHFQNPSLLLHTRQEERGTAAYCSMHEGRPEVGLDVGEVRGVVCCWFKTEN
jgi:hypothetical protein